MAKKNTNTPRVVASVHRFHQYVALAFLGVDGETIYLRVEDAAALAQALDVCRLDIEARSFTSSTLRTVEFPLVNNGSRFK